MFSVGVPLMEIKYFQVSAGVVAWRVRLQLAMPASPVRVPALATSLPFQLSANGPGKT